MIKVSRDNVRSGAASTEHTHKSNWNEVLHLQLVLPKAVGLYLTLAVLAWIRIFFCSR